MASEGLPGRRKRYHFLLSSLTTQEKELLARMIQKLGGTYFDSPHFIRGSSHVICGKPTRGEKFLCGCVSGKWILRKEFVLDSAKAGQWLDEVMYEWNAQCPLGGVSASHLSAPSRWRRFLQQKRGPFEGWKALVVVGDPKNRAAYKRLLEAGCAMIVNRKEPYPVSLANKLTHVFVEKALEHDIQALKDAGVPCLSPDYISEFILRESPPSSESFSVTVFSANRQPCANLKRAPENTPILGNIGNGGSGHTKRKIAQENEPLSKSRKVKPNWTPLCPSPRKKRKQDEYSHMNQLCVDRWKAVTTFQPVWKYDNHKVPRSEFPRYIVDTIESSMEESHYSSVTDVITSFLSSRRFPPPSLLRTVVERLLPKSPPSHQKSAFLLLQRVLFLHPPSKVPSLYESALSLPTEDGIGAKCSWQFVKSMCRCDQESSMLPLRFLTTLVEMDFHERLAQSISPADEKLHSLKATLLWRLFWPDLSSVCFNVRLRELFRLTWGAARCARDLPIKIPTLHTLQSLVAMAARCYALSDVAAFNCTENDLGTRMSERSRTFVTELSVVCRGSHENDVALRMFLETCTFTWLKMHVTDMILANYMHGLVPVGNLHLKTKRLSLEKIVCCYFFLLPGTKNINNTKDSTPSESLLSGRKRKRGPLELIGDKNHPNGSNNTLAVVSETNTNKTKRKELDRRNIKGETPLHVACIKNDLSKVKQLLADGADVNIKDYAGWTPLHEACNHGNVDCVREILQARLLVFGNDSGANLESTVNVLGAPSCGTTPLHDAAANNHRGVVDLLVRSGGLRLLDAKNKRGETPLEVTADPQMKEFLKTMALEYTNTSNTLIALHPSEDAYHAVLGRRGRRAVNHIPSKDCEQYVLLLSHLVQSYARIDPEHILWKDFNLCVDNLERHVTRIVADCHLSPLIKIRLSAMRLLSES